MKVKDIYFLKSCKEVNKFPTYNYPEFAFFGKSNVGKSSLINTLMNKKNLVKTGGKPGVTQLINFFVLNEKISIVDLPGYGYANAPKKIRDAFMPMIKSYVENRVNLKLAFLLIDIRRVPTEFEHNMIKLFQENEISIALTLTKGDKLSKNQRNKQISKIIKELDIEKDSIFETSSMTGEGKKEILNLIGDFSGIK